MGELAEVAPHPPAADAWSYNHTEGSGTATFVEVRDYTGFGVKPGWIRKAS